MTKIKLAKGVVNFVVGMGTSKIVADIIRNNTDPKNIVDNVSMFSAALVIGSMAADATREYTDTKIDELVTWWDEHIKSPQTQD